MSRYPYIKTQSVHDLIGSGISYQHAIGDKDDETTVFIGTGPEGQKAADIAIHQRSPFEVIAFVCDQSNFARDILSDASNDELGVDVNGIYVKPEELVEMMSTIEDEDEDMPDADQDFDEEEDYAQ